MDSSQVAAPITTCTIAMENGTLTVPCEVIGEALAITPDFGIEKGTGKGVFQGGFVVTHLPSGRTMSDGQGCVECCRSAGKALIATGVDWSAITFEDLPAVIRGWSELTKRAVADARAVAWSCDAEDCSPWPTTDEQGS